MLVLSAMEADAPFVFDPFDSRRLFVATTMGIFASENGGETWQKRMDGMKEVLMVVTLALDATQPTTMYAGTSGGMLAGSGTSKLRDGTKVDWFLWDGDRPAVHSYAAKNGYIAPVPANATPSVASIPAYLVT